MFIEFLCNSEEDILFIEARWLLDGLLELLGGDEGAHDPQGEVEAERLIFFFVHIMKGVKLQNDHHISADQFKKVKIASFMNKAHFTITIMFIFIKRRNYYKYNQKQCAQN